MENKKVILLIMDGWGKGIGDKTDAISCASTPFVDSLYKRYPHSELITYGEQVGLPEGQMGNSEVGHLNLGAGRVIYQDLVKIEIALREGQLATNDTFQSLIDHVKRTGCKLHIMGLVSDGGVHSSMKHLHFLLDEIKQANVEKVYLHAITDGRDTDPKSGKGFMQTTEEWCSQNNIQLASMIGRYYAMDRDKRWERVKLAYNLLTKGEGKIIDNWQDAITDML
jgi:2,3-bisphosphoglycerate-independent phosphoglycerate mutase